MLVVLTSVGQTFMYIREMYMYCMVNVSVKVNTKQLVIVTDTHRNTHRCITDREKSCACVGGCFLFPGTCLGLLRAEKQNDSI